MSRRPGFEAFAPFFRIIAEGLSGLVDGEDFFDMLAEGAVHGRAHRHEFGGEGPGPPEARPRHR